MKLLWVFLLMILSVAEVEAQQWLPAWEPLRLYITVPGGGQTPCTVDFEDFIAFAQAFNTAQGDENYNALADTNEDGVVNFPDFISFAQVFNLSYVGDVECARELRRHVKVSGQLVEGGQPLDHVWVDVLALSDSTDERSAETNDLGEFAIGGLLKGTHALVPERFGYVFEPDTLLFTMGDSSFSLPPIQGRLQFDLVEVQVLRDQLPVVGVDVSFYRAIAGQSADGPWSGITDTSGVTTIRVPVLDGASDIDGLYLTRVSNVATGEVVNSWSGVPVQTGDARRLVLNIEGDVHYEPARQYVFIFHQNQDSVSVSASETRLRMLFRDDVDEIAKSDLLAQLGLRAEGDDFYALMHTRGRDAVLETIHGAKRSGLVKLVTPEWDAGRSNRYTSDHVMVDFAEGTTQDEIDQFVRELGGSVVGIGKNAFDGLYEIEVFDLLSRDVFEICDQYRSHALVKAIQPHFEPVTVRW